MPGLFVQAGKFLKRGWLENGPDFFFAGKMPLPSAYKKLQEQVLHFQARPC